MTGPPLQLSQASGVAFYRQVQDQLADRIRAGMLAPGTPLPSVRQLAADLLVSVITVKKAYEELEAAGLVVSHQGKGTFVAETAPAASRAQVTKEVTEELTALVKRASALGIPVDTLEEAFRAAEDAFYPR